ncbi:isochorismate synthase [Vibrio sp. 10N.286.49.C2]|uniref:isochorismate synthase n=1 Tax=unclassified Vibrio TaxID=2614977 RepID=UPI000C85E4C6|nr:MULTISPECIES: isochorismate synthase MenF [unclassified Vibrio]PMH33072.1 isochorismate synthase [Vibrio sp. 10N.286.49.C2]PMH48969.1 isochorismate synthase [Vibrio sp. 10N.286.49.B1]PMH78592.1 isochorismate synthase [Vibrio sp. 10N.286.48.B7]
MSHLKQAIVQLLEKLKNVPSGIKRLEQPLGGNPKTPTIDWLDAQPHYPKFYWQSRDTREEVVALGQLHTFSEPAPAYAILGRDQRVWGGRSFDGHTEKNRRCMSAFFFLPQIELIRFDTGWRLAVNIGMAKETSILALQRLIATPQELAPLASSVMAVTHTPNESQWRDLVDDVLQGIEDDKFKKVVLARKTSIDLQTPISPAQLLKASYLKNHHSFHFLMALSPSHSFVGSTPERLYRRRGQELETEALAGTIGRGGNASLDMKLSNWLTQDAKNINENQYVVDDILQSLAPHSRSVEVEEELRLVRLRKVQHLKRNIHARLDSGINGVQLLQALQPTAAVAGLPRQAAMQYIEQHEPFARGWYAGSVGYLSHESAEFCVAIRSALLVNDQMQLFAGAGIVPGSVAEHEWQELDKKMSTLLSLISEHPPLGVAS